MWLGEKLEAVLGLGFRMLGIGMVWDVPGLGRMGAGFGRLFSSFGRILGVQFPV